ncbi:unnamed protein product [Peniophora sp. CBMAI 1063]|nr:unnamed protein product [Peniophora sp. CBMAI 1063]
MSSYKALPQTEELDPLFPASLDEPTNAEPRYTKLIRIVVYVLLTINTVLFVANDRTSATIRTSLDNVLPVLDPRVLPRPDQYDGLPEASRNKTIVLRDEDGNLVYPDAERRRSVIRTGMRSSRAWAP